MDGGGSLRSGHLQCQRRRERTRSPWQQGVCRALSVALDPRVQAQQLFVLRAKAPMWGRMKLQLPGSPTLSPSVLYPRSAPLHSFWSPVPVKMLSLPRFEHAFCCRKMKTMRPDVFLFLPWLPAARAKCVAPLRGAVPPAFSSTSSTASRGRCSGSPARVRTSGHLQAQPHGKGANQEETQGLPDSSGGTQRHQTCSGIF